MYVTSGTHLSFYQHSYLHSRECIISIEIERSELSLPFQRVLSFSYHPFCNIFILTGPVLVTLMFLITYTCIAFFNLMMSKTYCLVRCTGKISHLSHANEKIPDIELLAVHAPSTNNDLVEIIIIRPYGSFQSLESGTVHVNHKARS